MKTFLIMITALVTLPILAKEEGEVDPFDGPKTGIYSRVSSLNLTATQTVADAVKQIIEGLPPEGRSFFVVDVPESEPTKMQMKKDLRLRNTPLPTLLKFLGESSPVGYRLWNNEWHISNQRSDDLIAMKYVVSEADLEQLGIVIERGQTFATKSGKVWPPESESSVTFIPSIYAALYSTSYHSALIIDCGWSETRFLPVYKGTPLFHRYKSKICSV
jgi:hypothetical protein